MAIHLERDWLGSMSGCCVSIMCADFSPGRLFGFTGKGSAIFAGGKYQLPDVSVLGKKGVTSERAALTQTLNLIPVSLAPFHTRLP